MSAPTGCSLTAFDATCQWNQWSPPLTDSDFSNSPNTLVVSDVNGEIPSNALSGLTNSGGYSGGTAPQISFTCSFFNSYTMTLLSDSLSSNLNWVQEMSISDCSNMVINDGALSYMTGVTILTFLAGSFSVLSPTAFSGMTSLQTLYMYAAMPSTGVPSGLFSGLTSLQTLEMSRTTLNSIPSGLFSDLKSLQTLYLDDTGLTTLPADLFYPLLSLNSLTLDTNNWVCDCSLNWLEEYLTFTRLTNATCGSPTSLANYDLQRSIKSLGCTGFLKWSPRCHRLHPQWDPSTMHKMCLLFSTLSVVIQYPASSSDDWKIWVYCLTGAVSLVFLIAIVACIGCCRNRRKLEQYKQAYDARTPSNKKDEISTSKNWVAKTGYTQSVQKKEMIPVEETTKSYNKPQADISRLDVKKADSSTEETINGPNKPKQHDNTLTVDSGSWTPRRFRAARVSPSQVNARMYRAEMIDSI